MTKPTKSKEELRSLILSEIAAHAVCPAGMDVSIEAMEGGGWQALSIPPGPIAHADCVNYIGQIAQRLRSEYDLSPEPQYGALPTPKTRSSNPPLSIWPSLTSYSIE
jgi:hypothetical protein